MKRTELLKHLLKNGCILEREGRKHTLFFNPASGKSATVPRHREINTLTAKGICRDLTIKIIKKK